MGTIECTLERLPAFWTVVDHSIAPIRHNVAVILCSLHTAALATLFACNLASLPMILDLRSVALVVTPHEPVEVIATLDVWS